MGWLATAAERAHEGEDDVAVDGFTQAQIGGAKAAYVSPHIVASFRPPS